MSNTNDSPLPSSTKNEAATLLGDWLGIPVPSAVMRISSAPSFSVPGK
jgi:hypothetical protein